MNKLPLTLFAAGLALTLGSVAHAGVKVSCVAQPQQFDEGNFASFDLNISINSARVSKLVMNQSLTESLKAGVAHYANSTDPALQAYAKAAQFMLSTPDLQMQGVRKPYIKRAPKSPRLRYPMSFVSPMITSSVFDDLAPEALSMTLFVLLDSNKKPDLSKISIEYDGNQGPYYDHFICR